MYPLWRDHAVQATVAVVLVAGLIAGTGFRVSQLLTLPDQLAWIWTGIQSPWTRSAVVIALSVIWGWKARTDGEDWVERAVSERYNEELAPIVGNVWDVVVSVFFALVVLWTLPIDVGVLLAPAGVVGIVLGFAGRQTISNFFGSVSLYADETYEKGDFIEVDGVEGVVREISVRSTAVQTRDGNVVTIPNATLGESVIVNQSAPTSDRRVSTTVGVAYDADLGRVKAAIRDSLRDVSERDPAVTVESFGDSSIAIRAFVWSDVRRPESAVRDEMNERIRETLRDREVEIPFPQRDLNL